MIYVDGYSIEQYPAQNFIKITLPPTARTPIDTLLNARFRRETLTNDELSVVLMLVMEMLKEEGEEDE